MTEPTETKRPRIIIDLSAGNIRKIVADGEVDVLIVDFDNINDPDAVDSVMTFETHEGGTQTFETDLESYRSMVDDALLEAPTAPRP